jgi:predicted  nucleic acid-binding Zn-ribbon protein
MDHDRQEPVARDTENQLSLAKRVLQKERRKKKSKSSKLAKQNAKRALKTLSRGVTFLEGRRETLREAP